MAQLAAVLGALGAPLVLIRPRWWTVLAGFGLLTVAEVLLAGASPSAKKVALGLVGVAVLAAFAALLVRRRALVAPLVLVAAPFRLPLDFGGSHRFYVGAAHGGAAGRLLLLYLVLGAAALALAYRLVRERTVTPLPATIAYPLAAFVSFAMLSLLWAEVESSAKNEIEYFVIPFVVLVMVVAQAPFPSWMPRALGVIALVLASVFALVGVVEAATHRLIFYTSAVQIGNAYSGFFRVTSLFRDPSLYGRHLVLGTAVLLVAVWYRRVGIALGIGLAVLFFAGIFYSYSQSSLAALFAVILFVAAMAGDRRVRIAVGVTALLMLGAGAAFVESKVTTRSTQRVTSDRSRRIQLAARVYVHHPAVGVGLGSQPHASQQLSPGGGAPTYFVSHTTPLTIAAELGTIGLALYAALLAGTALALERIRRLDRPLGLSLEAVFVALFAHSLFYSGFFEDPMTWLVFGVAASALAALALRGGGVAA
jgi:hypothetical protein